MVAFQHFTASALRALLHSPHCVCRPTYTPHLSYPPQTPCLIHTPHIHTSYAMPHTPHHIYTPPTPHHIYTPLTSHIHTSYITYTLLTPHIHSSHTTPHIHTSHTTYTHLIHHTTHTTSPTLHHNTLAPHPMAFVAKRFSAHQHLCALLPPDLQTLCASSVADPCLDRAHPVAFSCRPAKGHSAPSLWSILLSLGLV